MSVTFKPTTAKMTCTERPCDLDGCRPEERCGYCRDGVFEDWDYDVPTINVANVTAAALLRILGLYTNDIYWCDSEVPVEQIGALRQKVMLALNSERRRSGEVTETYREERPAPVTHDGNVAYIRQPLVVHHFGISDERLVECLTRLDKVLAYCQEQGIGMRWC